MEDFDVDALVGSSGSGNALFHAARMRAEENDVSITSQVEQKYIIVAKEADYEGPRDDMAAANAKDEKEGRASLFLKSLPDMTPHGGVFRPMETFTDQAKTLYMSSVSLWSKRLTRKASLRCPPKGGLSRCSTGFKDMSRCSATRRTRSMRPP